MMKSEIKTNVLNSPLLSLKYVCWRVFFCCMLNFCILVTYSVFREPFFTFFRGRLERKSSAPPTFLKSPPPLSCCIATELRKTSNCRSCSQIGCPGRTKNSYILRHNCCISPINCCLFLVLGRVNTLRSNLDHIFFKGLKSRELTGPSAQSVLLHPTSIPPPFK